MNTTQTFAANATTTITWHVPVLQSQLELPMDQQLEGHDLVAQLCNPNNSTAAMRKQPII